MSGDLNLEKRVEDVAAGFDVLKSASVSFEECLAHSEAPITLPGLEKQHQGVARAAVAKELCLLWLPDPNDQDPPLGVLDDYGFDISSGLIVCDDELKLGAERLNAAKASFYDAMMALRDALKLLQGTQINNYRYLQAVLAKRDQRLGEELSKLGLARLDLTACYRRIRILPNTLRSISWTWARRHTAVKDISYKELIKLIESEIAGDTKEQLIKIVASLPESTHFARKFDKRNQLRANLTYLDGTKRNQIQISGVCLVEDRMPAIVRWATPTDKMDNTRIGRTDKVISEVSLFKNGLLNIFLYEDEGKAAKRRKREELGGADEP